jgi:hypothetical protein
MKPRDMFDTLARMAGFVVVLYGCGHILYGLLAAMGLLETTYERYNAVVGVIQLVGGLMVMRGVISVVDIAFPPESPRSLGEQAECSEERTEDEGHRG